MRSSTQVVRVSSRGRKKLVENMKRVIGYRKEESRIGLGSKVFQGVRCVSSSQPPPVSLAQNRLQTVSVSFGREAYLGWDCIGEARPGWRYKHWPEPDRKDHDTSRFLERRGTGPPCSPQPPPMHKYVFMNVLMYLHTYIHKYISTYVCMCVST